jgi:hypothetical protein
MVVGGKVGGEVANENEHAYIDVLFLLQLDRQAIQHLLSLTDCHSLRVEAC